MVLLAQLDLRDLLDQLDPLVLAHLVCYLPNLALNQSVNCLYLATQLYLTTLTSRFSGATRATGFQGPAGLPGLSGPTRPTGPAGPTGPLALPDPQVLLALLAQLDLDQLELLDLPFQLDPSDLLDPSDPLALLDLPVPLVCPALPALLEIMEQELPAATRRTSV